MEGESGLDSSSESTSLGTTKKLSFSEYADELCGFYMSIGVPYREYWYGDYTQLKHYFEAYKIAEERFNYHAWLQGGYVYDAICCASPILHAFAKAGTKPVPYLSKPYEFRTKVVDKEKVRQDFLARWRANKSLWQAIKKGGELNGGDDRSATTGDQIEQHECGG